MGGLQFENFNAARAKVHVKGRSVHPGASKNKMINASLVAMALDVQKNDFPAEIRYVQNREQFLAALERLDFDIILSDYRMPDFDGEQALKVARERCPEIPFIMVTGELGEDRVIETLKRGATDYVLKDRIFRLVPSIQRALAEAEVERKQWRNLRDHHDRVLHPSCHRRPARSRLECCSRLPYPLSAPIHAGGPGHEPGRDCLHAHGPFPGKTEISAPVGDHMKRYLILLSSFALVLAACSVAAPTNQAPVVAAVEMIPMPTNDPAPTPTLFPAAGANQELTRTDQQGMVVIEITPLDLGTTADSLEFNVAMNTHSVDLSMDLASLSTLTTDAGLAIAASKWDAPPGGGHHLSGHDRKRAGGHGPAACL